MKKITETDRLILRELTPDDAPFIYRLLNTPGWLRFIGDRHVHDVEDARLYLARGPIHSYRTLGFGLWAAVLKDTETPVGMCGLLKRDFLDDADIGFALLPEFGGAGHAYEMAAAVMDHARRVLGIPRIVAIVSKNNVRSVRLLEKLGMTYERTVSHPGENEPLLLMAPRTAIHDKTTLP